MDAVLGSFTVIDRLLSTDSVEKVGRGFNGRKVRA